MTYNPAWGKHIPDGLVNKVIEEWQAKQPERNQIMASPSTLTECPRVVWLRKQGVGSTSVLGWGKKQRFLLGRITENLIAQQMKDEGILLHHWKDDIVGESEPFVMGEGELLLIGTPDLLLALPQGAAISDAKTSRSDSFVYVPIDPDEIWKDPYWFRYKLQLTAYYMLAHQNPEFFAANALPLPEFCHLFSYALDDGIVRREIIWVPTDIDRESVIRLTRRWNRAFSATDMPACTCIDDDLVKFCPFATEFTTTKNGAKLGIKCCDDSLKPGVPMK